MGWEWRIFYEGDHRAAFEAHAVQQFPTFHQKGMEDEVRTDVYVSCSRSVGLKARGSATMGDIEVKRRLKRKRRGAELWTKERMARLDPGKGAENRGLEDNTLMSSSVLADFTKLLEANGRSAATAAEVTLTKSRAMYKVPSVDDAAVKSPEKAFKGVSIECTLVRLLPGNQLFTSICVEHSDKAKKVYSAVEALALEDFAVTSRIKGLDEGEEGEEDSGDDGGEGRPPAGAEVMGDADMTSCVQGYPAFILYAAQLLHNTGVSSNQ